MPERTPYRTSGDDAKQSAARFSSSGRLTPLLVGLLCAAILIVSFYRGKGMYHRLHERLLPDRQPVVTPAGPGGEDAMMLHRDPSSLSATPEFVSATLLPGRGMQILQLTAVIPGHGEVPLLVAPTLDEATAELTDTGADANGALGSTFGAAFLAPWASRATGKPSTSPGLLETSYNGMHLTFPAATAGGFTSTEGLLLDRAADTSHTGTMVDGQTAEADFKPGSFSGGWPAPAEVKVSVGMSSRQLDLTVTVHNAGQLPIPAAIGWKPHFAIAGGDRRRTVLFLPAAERLESDRTTHLPNGRLLPVAGSPADFAHARGATLTGAPLDETYVHLLTPALSPGPLAEMRNLAWGFGIRVAPLSNNVRFMRVVAPADKPWVEISPDMNAGDPFGPQWIPSNPSGMQTLEPGESLTWKVRVELFPLSSADRAAGESNLHTFTH